MSGRTDQDFARAAVSAASRAVEHAKTYRKAWNELRDADYILANDLRAVQNTPLWGTTLLAIGITEDQAEALIAWRLMSKDAGPVAI